MQRTVKEMEDQINVLWDIEAKAPAHLKEGYAHAYEVIEWCLGKREEEDVMAFGV